MSAALEHRLLGRTGYSVPVLGIGGWLGALEDPQATESAQIEAGVAAVQRAVALGVTYFDTSPSYLNLAAQRNLGLGLRSLAPEVRATIRVATKAGTHPARPHQYDAAAIRWSVDDSLAALFADHLDVLLVHDPRDDADMDVIMAPGGALEALDGLKAQGVIGAIGLGVRRHRFLRRAIESRRFDVLLTPYDYSLVRTSAAPVIALAAARGLGVVNGSPYAAGLIAGLDPDVAAVRRSPLAPQDVPRARALWRWCQERDVDLGAVAMQFSLRQPQIAVTLAGPRTAAEVEGNVRHATTALPDGLWADLKAYLARLDTEAGPPGPGGEVDE